MENEAGMQYSNRHLPFKVSNMKKVAAVFLMITITGCQYLPMQEKESLPGYFTLQYSALHSNGHELRGYDFPQRHYY